jgi:RNA polymerase sigma-70 factor (ECF subfamily)
MKNPLSPIQDRSSPPASSGDLQVADDARLVELARAGNRGAFRVLVERYQGRLLAMATDILKSREEAEDVVQESFVKAYLALDTFKGESSWYTWLYRIAYNMALDSRRRAERRGGAHIEYREDGGVKPQADRGDVGGGGALDHLQNFEQAQNIAGPHEALLRKQTSQRLKQVLKGLSPEHRSVIMLREVDGLSYDEISAATGVPRGTVMSRLFYARKALQEALREFAPEGELERAAPDGDSFGSLGDEAGATPSPGSPKTGPRGSADVTIHATTLTKELP